MVLPIERRRTGQTRLPIHVPVETDPFEIPSRSSPGITQDLSAGGIMVRLEHALVRGAPVRVTLRLSQRPPVTLTGTVAWIRPHPDFPGWALGIRFNEELPGEMAAEIADAEYPPWGHTSRGARPH